MRLDVYFHLDPADLQGVKDQLTTLTALVTQQGNQVMSKQAELEAAVADLSTTIAKVATDIEHQLAIVTAGTSDEAVTAAVTAISSLTATLKQKATDLEADDPVT